MNGDRLASAVKSHAPNTPVVLLTGFGSVMDPDLDTPKDVDVLLSKPVSVEKTLGRNDPCHCGSGKKYKKCHGR